VKAVVWHGTGDIRIDEVPDPKILEPSDAIIRVTRSANGGTDLHLVRGTMPGMQPGTILGHEAVGTVGITGVYPPQHDSFPVGAAMNRNLTIKMGNCNHRRYVPGLLSRIASGGADPITVRTQQEAIPTALEAYEAFDRREPGWTKVILETGG
jgi:threonine dehydrogenase-like Zn-dependent dehydrogenase